MKDIRAILNDYELTDEQREAIAKEVRANYKTIADWQKKADRIAELEEANAAFAEKVKALEADGEQAEALRKQVADYEAAEAARIAEAEKAKAEADFRKSFEEAVGANKFANAIVEKAVFDATFAACTANPGKGAKEALDEAIKGADGIWLNPQRDPAKMPTQSQVASTAQRTHAQDAFLTQLFGPLPDK